MAREQDKKKKSTNDGEEEENTMSVVEKKMIGEKRGEGTPIEIKPTGKRTTGAKGRRGGRRLRG